MNARAAASGRRRSLHRNLWRIGSWGSWTGVNALGAVLALISCLALGLGCAAALLASATYAHREAVGRARSPVPADASSTPALRWQFVPSAVDDRIVGVHLIEPVASGAPLPPGVARWPAPGEALLSPALLDLLTERGVPDRYGTVAGVIGPEGLAAPTELLAYGHLPAPLSLERAWDVAGFGVPPPHPFLPTGELLYDRSVAEFWSLSGVLLVLPGVIALLAAARVADEHTRRRHVLLARMGANRRARAMIAAPRVLLPAAGSLAVCLLLLALATAVDLRIPFKGNVIEAAVVREARWVLALALVGTHAVAAVALAALTAGRQGRLHAARLGAPADSPAWGRTSVLVLVLAGQPWVLVLVDDPTVRSLSTLAAAVVAVLCLPPALATAMRGASPWLAARGLAAAKTGQFLGWRITHFRSRALARLTASVCGLIIVTGHGAVVLALFTGPALEARQLAARLGSSLLVAAPQAVEAGAGEVVRFAHERDLAAVAVTRTFEEPVDAGAAAPGAGRDTVVLTGACEDLRALAVPCRNGRLTERQASVRLHELVRWYAPLESTEVLVSVTAAGTRLATSGDAPAPDGDGPVVFLAPAGRDLDPVVIARDAFHAGLPLSVEQLGAGWLLGANELLHKSYWVFVFGVPGVVTLLVVSALVWAAVVVEESRTLLRTPLLAERRDVFATVAAVRVALPVAVGGLTGAGATAWLLAPHARIGSASIPVGFLATSAAAALLAAAVAGACAARFMAAASRRHWEG